VKSKFKLIEIVVWNRFSLKRTKEEDSFHRVLYQSASTQTTSFTVYLGQIDSSNRWPLSFHSVQSASSSPAVLANSPGVIYFGDTGGSFTFNPLANFPVIVIQGFYVLATYAAIIIWALILGAIIWGISISQFSGLFSGNLKLKIISYHFILS